MCLLSTRPQDVSPVALREVTTLISSRSHFPPLRRGTGSYASATTWTLTGPGQPNLPGTPAQEERPPPHRLHSAVQSVGRAYPLMRGLDEDLCRLGLRPGRRCSHLPPLLPALVMVDRERRWKRARLKRRRIEGLRQRGGEATSVALRHMSTQADRHSSGTTVPAICGIPDHRIFG